MNNAISTLLLDLSLRSRFRRGALRRAARDATRGQPPQAGHPYAAEDTILAAFSRRLRAPSYWATPTLLALLAAAVFAGLSLTLWFNPSLPLAHALLAGAAATSALCLLYACFATLGPEFISEQRFVQARRELDESGDSTVRLAGLVSTALILAGAIIDGLVNAMAVLPYFEETLTPSNARLAAWSVAIAIALGLFKLTQGAAREARIRATRRTYRALAATNPEAAARMRALTSAELGGDFSQSRRPFMATLALVVVGGAIAVAVFLGRLHAPSPLPATPSANELSLHTASARIVRVDNRDAPGVSTPSAQDSSGNVLAAGFMFGVFVLAAAGAFYARYATTPVRLRSDDNLRIIRRFDSLDELQQFHRQHAESIALRCRDALLRFARELQNERARMDPARMGFYPDPRMHELASELLRKAMGQSAGSAEPRSEPAATTQASANW